MPEEQRPGPTEAAAWLVAGLAFAVALLVFRTATILPAGLFDGTAAALVAIGAAPLAHRRLGAAAGTILRGAGLVAATLLITASLVAPWDRAAPPLAVLIAGGALLQAARGRAMAIAGGVVLAAGWALGWWLSSDFPEPGRLKVALLLAAAGAVALLALRAWLVRTGHDALAPGPAGLLAGVAVGATYLAYRSLVAGHVGNLPLYEWSLGVALSLLLLARIRRGAREGESPEAWSSEARRHAQDSTPLYDARMGPLAAVLARYLETGAGFEEYRATLERAAPEAAPRVRAILARPLVPEGRSRAARREAAAQRLAAHKAALEAIETPIRSR